MARLFARYLKSTHHDPDWHSLTTCQHDCYMALLSSDDLSWAGVAPYVPSRYAGLAKDLSVAKVTRTWDELDEVRYLVIDKDAGEVGVRTFLRGDGVLGKPNLVKAFLAAWPKVRSALIRESIVDLLTEEHRLHPSLAGWKTISDLDPDLFDDIIRRTVHAEVTGR